jgi:ATP-dependent DNA helicase RecQ
MGTDASEPLTRSAVIRPATRHRFQEIGELFAAGQSLEQVARHFDILPETVIQHLCRFHEAGGTLDPERLLAASRLPGPERARVLSAFERLGHERLAPVYEALSRAVPYQELHLLRLYWLLMHKQYD